MLSTILNLFSAKTKLIILISFIGLIGIGGYTAYWYNKGKTVIEAKQATEQLKTEIKVRKQYEKIDRQTPYTADKPVAIDWLRKHTTRN